MRFMRVTAILLLLAVAAPVVPADPPTSTKPDKSDPPKPAESGTAQKPVYPKEVGGKDLKAWVDLMDDRDPGVRDLAVKAVCFFDPEIATKEAGQALLKRLEDKDSGIRVNALLAIGSMGGVYGDYVPEALKAIQKRIAGDPQSVVRYHAIVCLGRFDQEARPAMVELIKQGEGIHDQGSYEIRRASVIALARIGAGKAAQTDKNGKVDEPEVPVDMTAVRQLLALCDARPFVQTADSCTEIRLLAVRGVAAMGIPKAPADWQTLLDGLKNSLPDKKESIVIAAHAGLFNHVYAMEQMREAVKEHEKKEKDPKKQPDKGKDADKPRDDNKDKKEVDKGNGADKAKEADKTKEADKAKEDDPQKFKDMAKALEQMKDPGKSEAHLVEIAKFTTNRDPLIRLEALSALASLGPRAAPKLNELLALTADPELSIKVSAVMALGGMGDAAVGAVPELQKKLDKLKDDKGEEQFLKAVLQYNIDHITGKDKGEKKEEAKA